MPAPDSAVNLGLAFAMPPEAALAYFRSKGYEIAWDWRDVWREAHAKAFTVAGILKTDALKVIHESLARAMQKGETFATWQRGLVPQLEALGLWGRHKLLDPETGEVKTLSPWRLETIFRTNLQSAYMAGRYQQQLANAAERPYWQYVAVMDGRTRPSHAALHNRVFRFDDPIWRAIYPPNGFNCRCRVRARTADELQAAGLDVSTSEGRLSTVEATPWKDRGPIQVTRFEYAPGKFFTPDPGWDYNPAEASGLLRTVTEKLDRAPEPIARQAAHELLQSDAFARWWHDPQGAFPLVVLPDADAARIGARTHTGVLSADTATKQLRVHPELTVGEYARAQDVIDRGKSLQDSPRSLIYILEEPAPEVGGYVLVVKATLTGEGLFVTSYRRLHRAEAVRDAEIARLLRKGNKREEKE